MFGYGYYYVNLLRGGSWTQKRVVILILFWVARSVQETHFATPWGHLGRDLASTIARPRRGF